MKEKIKFLLVIDGVFYIKGTVVTGRVLEGQIKQNDMLEIRCADKVIKTKCINIEKHFKKISEAKKNDYIGITLADVTKSELSSGMKLIIAD